LWNRFQSGCRTAFTPVAGIAAVRRVVDMMRDGEGGACQDALNKWRVKRAVTELNVLLEASFVP
jgi:hypothetical protein